MGLPCGPVQTVTWGMPRASSCTSSIRARRDLAAMRAAYSVGFMGRPMELIVEDAEFVTMAPGTGSAQAMLVRDGRIAAVGPAEAVRAAASPGARAARLDGATVIPGLIDAHCHVCDVGYLAAGADCSQPSAPDIPAIQARLAEAAGRTPEGSWVTGGGYVEYKLREGRHPTRADLDRAVPNRPAVVYHTSLH